MSDIKNDIIGGQAVIEGVMMINKQKMAVAVRDPDNKIVIKKEKIKKPPLSEVPLVRGIIKLFLMMAIGIKALNYSVDISEEGKSEGSGIGSWIMVIFSIILAIAIFKFVPLFFANALKNNYNLSNIAFNITDGIIKIGIFVLYIFSISFFKDVKRIFQYHGAEHKTVHCYEAKKPLNYENVKKFTTLHPRCGTAFVMIVLGLSIIVYTFIPADSSFWTKLVLRILLLPVIAGISYEMLRISAKFQNNFFFKMLIQPGLILQKITTKEPDKKQIEVAIASLKAVI